MPLIVTPITVRIAVASAGARSGFRSRPSSSTWTADSDGKATEPVGIEATAQTRGAADDAAERKLLRLLRAR